MAKETYARLRDGLILAWSSKSGSSSFHVLLSQRPEVDFGLTQHDVYHARSSERVVYFMREPLARLKSCYQYSQEAGWTVRHGADFESFVHAATVITNEHWSPVTAEHTYRDTFLPTEVYRFEDINETFPQIIGEQMITRNAARSPRWELPLGGMESTYESHWAADIQLYKELS